MNEIRPLQDLPERYEVEPEPLYMGGMGVIWVATDRDLDRQVAVKSLRAKILGYRGAYERLSRETRILSRLSHPGICPIFDRHLLSDPPCYTMPLIHGRTLKEAIRAHHDGDSSITLRQLVNSLVSVANTVAYAHEQGIIHRDLKPDNIILGSFGEVFVMDWGVAGAIGEESTSRFYSPPEMDSRLSSAGDVIGTPAYAAPEQRRGEFDKIGPYTDVYGLGAILHEILTNQPPGSAGPCGPGETKAKDLHACCVKALSEEPADRYPDALAFRDELERYLASHLVKAARYTVFEKLAKLVRRNRKVLRVASAVAMGFLVVLAGFFLKYLHDLSIERHHVRVSLSDALKAQGALLLNNDQPVAAQQKLGEALAIKRECSVPLVPTQLYLADTLRACEYPVLTYSFPARSPVQIWEYESDKKHLYSLHAGELLVHEMVSGIRSKSISLEHETAGLPYGITNPCKSLVLLRETHQAAVLEKSGKGPFIQIRNLATGALDRVIKTTLPYEGSLLAYRPPTASYGKGQLVGISVNQLVYWDLEDQEAPPRTVLVDLGRLPDSAEFSRNGHQVLLGGKEFTSPVTLLAAETGQVIWSLPGNKSGQAIFLPQRHKILAWAGAELLLLDQKTGEVLQRIQVEGDIRDLAALPDHGLVVRGGGRLSLFRTDDLSLVKTMHWPCEPSKRVGYQVFVSSHGFVVVDPTRNQWHLWEKECTSQQEMVLPEEASCLAIHWGIPIAALGTEPDLGAGVDHPCVFLVDLATGKQLGSLNLMEMGLSGIPRNSPLLLTSLLFRPDEQELIVNLPPRGAFRYTLAGLQAKGSLPSSAPWVGCSPQGDQLVSVRQQEITLHALASGKELFSVPAGSQPWWVGFMPGGTRILSTHHQEHDTGECPIRIWDGKTGKLLRKIDLKSPNYTARFHPDGKTCFIGQYNGKIARLDLPTGTWEATYVHPDPILDLALSPDGKWLLTRSYTGDAKVLDTTTLQPRWESQDTRCMAITTGKSRGALFWVSRGNKVLPLDPTYPQRYLTLQKAAQAAMTRVQASPIDPTAMVTIGRWLYFRGAYSLASVFLEVAWPLLRHKPGEGVDPMMLCRTYWLSGQLAKAQRSLVFAGDHSDFYRKLLVEAVEEEGRR